MQIIFKTRIQKLLPKLRQGKADPVELTNLISDYVTSPYYKEKFLALLSARQKEIETAEFIIYNPEISNQKVKSIICMLHYFQFQAPLVYRSFPKLC